MYATNVGGTWKYEPVSSQNSGTNAIAVDVNGNVHIAFYDNGLMYATNKGGSWSVTSVDSSSGQIWLSRLIPAILCISSIKTQQILL